MEERRLRGGRIGGKGRGGEKGVEKVGEGLEGEDFPGNFRETPRPPDPTRTSFVQNQRPPPVRGRSPTPSLPLAYAHMRGVFVFSTKYIL